MDRAGFEDWLRRYFDAWVSNDPVGDGILTIAFAPDGRCREHRQRSSQREIS
jgi:hypothetical protein